VQLRARDGRALLAGEAGDVPGLGDDRAEAGSDVEVDPHTLALGADLADALHEWARVADAVHRNGQSGGSAAAKLISRRGQQLAARLAAVMGSPVSYADPLTGEVTVLEVPDHAEDEPGPVNQWWSERTAARHRAAEEPTPWSTGLAVSVIAAIMIMIVVITLSLSLGQANRWLPLIANVVIALGLAPSVWLARRTPVWRWVAFGVMGGLAVAWIALLFTAI
jgi:uncharacterized protein DUF2537